MHETVSDSAPIFHPASAPDYLPESVLRELQLRRLQSVVGRCFENVPLFRQRMGTAQLRPEDVRALEDLARLPFTQKSDLRETYPFGLFASPLSEVVRLHASSGTTGKPIVVAYTQEDINVWTEVMLRCFAACGMHRGDIVQNAYGYGLFTGGLGAHYGAEALGATVIPVSGGNTDRQIMILRDFGVTAICCTPSYFIHLIERAKESGVGLHDLPLRVGIFGAEPWTEAMRAHIQDEADIEAFDIFGLTEIIGPGVGIECHAHNGLHIFEDHFLPEIVDPVTGRPLPDGEEGELVLTTLTKKAMPMIRYRTHDITRIKPGFCTCGRTIRRIERIARRSDDMLIIRGVNLFPAQIETVLLSMEGTTPHYQIILTREKGLDQIEVQVEVTHELFSDTIGGLEQLRKRISHQLEIMTGLRMEVSLVAPRTIQRSEGKAKRVKDQRNTT
jgi:phenylacetate-CoA ligase